MSILITDLDFALALLELTSLALCSFLARSKPFLSSGLEEERPGPALALVPTTI